MLSARLDENDFLAYKMLILQMFLGHYYPLQLFPAPEL